MAHTKIMNPQLTDAEFGTIYEREYIKNTLLKEIEAQWLIDRDKPEYANVTVFEYIKSKL